MSAFESLACENKDESLSAALLLSPLRTIFGKSSDKTLWVYCWAFLIGLYSLIYYVVPACALNTYQGFKSGWVSLLWSLGLFLLLIATFIVWFRKSACDSKKLRLDFFKNEIGNPPTWLQPFIAFEKSGKKRE